MFLFAVNIKSSPSFVKSLSNLCQIFVKSKSFSRECFFMQWFFLKHSPPTVCRRKTSKLRSICKHSDQPALLQYGPQKVFLILYTHNWSHDYVYIYPLDWSHRHWNIIFPGILRRFGGWLLRNRVCLIVSQNHALGFGTISKDLRSWLYLSKENKFLRSQNFKN